MFRAPLLLLLAPLGVDAAAESTCKRHEMDFILLAGDPLMQRIEDDVRIDLEKIGITVKTRLLEKADFNAAMASGDFNLCFTETWGPPYDPHSFATGWFRPNNEAHYPALEGLDAPMTKAKMQEMVTEALSTETEQTRIEKWSGILQEMHQQAMSMPMWSRRMPAVFNRRLTGYQAGHQQWDYPMHTVQVQTGSSTVSVSPGAQTGLFTSLGHKDPHSYRPNEFFFSNWVYEGLVSYGPNGAILPQLATSWTVADTAGGEQQYTFELRSGVTFHDGEAWNCSAAKMNFDHVLQPPLHTTDYHGWYYLPKYTKSWECSDAMTFVVTLSQPYYPFLQELSLIRPLRMLSPNSFKSGATTDPKLENSCPISWGTPAVDGETVSCVGVRSFKGTGPWEFDEAATTSKSDGSIEQAVFVKNAAWWGTHGTVDKIIAKAHASAEAVEAALLSGSLDMVVGGGVLTPLQVQKFETQHVDEFQTVLGPPLMNTIIVLNAAKAPTDDTKLRRTIMHAVNKAAIVDTEMAGQATVADALFPKDAPYCDLDLTPRWDYDFEKASLLNCPATVISDAVPAEEGSDVGVIVGIAVAIGVLLACLVGVLFYRLGRKAGYQDLAHDKKQAPLNGNSGVKPTLDRPEPAASVVGSQV